ncbi:hypothetical protein LCGC14_2273130, partial [marine sediment metagenome]
VDPNTKVDFVGVGDHYNENHQLMKNNQENGIIKVNTDIPPFTMQWERV